MTGFGQALEHPSFIRSRILLPHSTRTEVKNNRLGSAHSGVTRCGWVVRSSVWPFDPLSIHPFKAILLVGIPAISG